MDEWDIRPKEKRMYMSFSPMTSNLKWANIASAFNNEAPSTFIESFKGQVFEGQHTV